MITVAGKDLTSGSARFEKIQVVLRTFRTWLLGTRLESRNSWFETQIYAKTRCNTHDFFASKAIEKTSTIIGEMFRRKSQKRGSWITVLQLGWVVAKLGLLQTIKAAHHLCMIDKKIERWMLFRGNNNLYLKGYHPNRFHWEIFNFRRKVFQFSFKQNNILLWNSF